MLLGLLGTLTGMLLGWVLAFYISRLVLRIVTREMTSPEDLITLPESIFSIDVSFCLLLLAGAAVVSLLAGL